MNPPFLSSGTTQPACLTCWSFFSHWHVTLKLEEHQHSPTAVEHHPKATLAHVLQGHAPVLASHSFAAHHVGWTRPGGVDNSEIQSYSCHKTKQPGDGDILAMPHWRKGFAVTAQHNCRCPVPLNGGSAPTRHQTILSSDVCTKASFMSPTGLGSTVPSYTYITGL